MTKYFSFLTESLRIEFRLASGWHQAISFSHPRLVEEHHLPGGAEVLFDYSIPKRSLEAADAANRDVIAAKAAETGKEFRNFFEPEELHAELHACGFRQICDLGPYELAGLFLTDPGASPLAGAHVLHAATF